MTAAAKQFSQHAANDWIPIDEAQPLMDVPLRTLQHKAKTQWVRQGSAELRPPRGGRGKPTWWIKRRVDKRLAACPNRDTREVRQRESLLEKYPAHFVEDAYRKARWLQVLRDRVATPRLAGETDLSIAKQVVDAAKLEEGAQYKISVRSLQLWKAAYETVDESGVIKGVEALVPQYGSGGGDGDAPRSPEAIKFFYDLYRTESRISVRIAHDFTVRQAKIDKWDWPSSYDATRRWLAKYDDVPMSFLLRRGQSAYSKKYMPHLEMDWSAVSPGEFYTADHTQVDFWVSYKGKNIRPWLTVIQDCRTRCITGWRLGDSPNQEAILLAMRQAYGDWAIPKVFRVDNGKDFTSKAITGLTKRECRVLKSEARKRGENWKDNVRRARSLVICDDVKWQGVMSELGIEVIYAIPYAAWAKGTVERFFGTFHAQCGKLFATYCGNSPTTRPESLAKILKGKASEKTDGLELIDASVIPTMQQAREQFGDWLDIYHNSPHQGSGVDGKHPLDVWNASSASIQKADPESLAFLLSIRGTYKVGPNGVGVEVAGTKLTYGGKSVALKRWIGRKVLISVDLEYPSESFAFDPDTRRMIGRLEPNERIHPYAQNEDVRSAVAQMQRDRKGMRQAARSSARRTRTAVQLANQARAAQVAEIRATGTDACDATVVPVRTGFEGQSKPARSVDVPRRDLSDAAAAIGLGTLGFTHANQEDDDETITASLDLLAPRMGASIDDEDYQGKDADPLELDPLGLVAGIRHDRQPSDK